MAEHIVDGQFQSDKYTWCRPGFVPLKLTDPGAQPLLWFYARLREPVDAEFADDLREALLSAGFDLEAGPEGWALKWAEKHGGGDLTVEILREAWANMGDKHRRVERPGWGERIDHERAVATAVHALIDRLAPFRAGGDFLEYRECVACGASVAESTKSTPVVHRDGCAIAELCELIGRTVPT